jgi:hypothetical protein
MVIIDVDEITKNISSPKSSHIILKLIISNNNKPFGRFISSITSTTAKYRQIMLGMPT